MEQNAASLEIDHAACGFKREDGIRADAGNGTVVGGQFGAGLGARADAFGRFDEGIQLCRSRGRRAGRKEINFFDDLGHGAFSERRCMNSWQIRGKQNGENSYCFHAGDGLGSGSVYARAIGLSNALADPLIGS